MNHNETKIPSIKEEDKDLLKRIADLEVSVQSSRCEVKDKVKEIKQKIEEAIQLNNDERKRKDEEIKELTERVSQLEEEVRELRKRAQIADTIDAGEAIKIMEYHVAKFVLPDTEEIGDDAIQDMLDYLRDDAAALRTWQSLTKMCKMQMSWTPRHTNVQKNLIQYRNADAHHKKFDFARLQREMFKKRPRHKRECEDIIRLFRKVNHLMKFGIIASDFMKIEPKPGKCTEASRKLLEKSAKTWARENVLYLQDIKLTEAKEHVVQYFPDVDDSIWSSTISIIFDTNRLRFGKLVENKEAKVLKEVVQIFVQIPECKTLEELINFSRSKEWKENRRAEGARWYKSTAGISWTESHDNAMKAMKGLLPDDQRKDVDPLPLHVAKLHVADFVKNHDLWEASSEILGIFEWDKKGNWEKA